MNDDSETHSDDLKSFARGPMVQARRFTTYNVNGYKFRTVERDENLKTQNSGVFASFGTKSYASTSDSRPMEGVVPYYGKLVDIIELNYFGRIHVVLFKCKWANTTNPRYIKMDALGFTSVNFSRLIHTGDHEDDEPYIKASEAQQVFYVTDQKDQEWSIPVHIKPRDLYDMGESVDDFDIVPFQEQDLHNLWSSDAAHLQLSRDDVDVEMHTV